MESILLLRRLAVLLCLAGCGDGFRPRDAPPPEPPPGDAPGIVRAFERAYAARDVEAFAALLAGEPGAAYRFVASDPAVPAPGWDRERELCIHRRLFDPLDVLPGEPPVPAELLATRIHLALTQETAFAERPDLYRSAANPAGLDSLRWRAVDAVLGADVRIETAGETDYSVFERWGFVVLEDRGRAPGQAGKFLLYVWEELGTNARRRGDRIAWYGGFRSAYCP